METQQLEQWNIYMDVDTGEYLGEGIFLSREYVEKKQEAQVNKAEGFAKKKKKDEFSQYINSNFGSFYFNNYMKLLKKLNNNTALLFRFLYLCTYADYDGYLKYGNYSYSVHHGYMTEKDFEDVFKMSKAMITKLKKELYDNNLIIKSKTDDRLIVNGSFYTRGELCLGDMLESSRVFDDGIKELYEKSNPREHKKIGVLIPLLPYLNKYHNILCNKPLEKELKYIEPLTLREICKIVDYDSSNEDKLKKQLESITVKDNPMVAFISHAKGRFFVVNPSLFYKGNCLDDLTGVINLFKVENNISNEPNT